MTNMKNSMIMKMIMMMKTKPMMQQKITGESITESDPKSVRKLNNINLTDEWLRFVTTHLDFKKTRKYNKDDQSRH